MAKPIDRTLDKNIAVGAIVGACAYGILVFFGHLILIPNDVIGDGGYYLIVFLSGPIGAVLGAATSWGLTHLKRENHFQAGLIGLLSGVLAIMLTVLWMCSSLQHTTGVAYYPDPRYFLAPFFCVSLSWAIILAIAGVYQLIKHIL